MVSVVLMPSPLAALRRRERWYDGYSPMTVTVA